MRNLLILFILAYTFYSQSAVKVEYSSLDKLIITADLYMTSDKSAPFIILFHQAGWSRGEYLEIAPKLNKMGFNCLAVDQRSGNKVNHIVNETAKRALEQEKPSQYIDAIPDMIATVHYIEQKYSPKKLIVWGSSYSSALVLNLVGEGKINADAVISFAPGEYFSTQGKSKTFIQDAVKNIKVPVFITSAKNEKPYWEPIMNKIDPNLQHSYLPITDGNHGSRALWEKFEDHEGYWTALVQFLNKVK